MPALSKDILAKVLEALRIHHNALRVAGITGVSQSCVWRIAKKHGITLISLAEHMKARRSDPAFVAKQLPAVRKGAGRWLKAKHKDPKFHKKSIEAARRNLTRLNLDPAFRQASSDRLKRLHEDPAFVAKLEGARHATFRRKRAERRNRAIEAALWTLTRLDSDPAFRLAASERLNRLSQGEAEVPRRDAARPRHNRGFAIAPILYLLGLIGVGAGVLFSGYSQILRSNQTMANTMAAKNDLQGTATTLAASSWLSTDQTLLCPPMVGSGSPQTPSTKCSTANGAITVGTSFDNAVTAKLPANYASVSSAGSPVEVGVFAAGSGAKVLDPWGHYYVYCRWENPIGTSNALMVISAGPDGNLQTNCGSTTAGGDNLFVVWTTAVTQNRAAVWQTITSGTSVTGAQFGATGSQVYIGTTGNMTIPGTLGVTGETTLGTGGLSVTGATNLEGLSASTGAFTGNLSAANGSFTGTLNASGTTTLNGLSAGSSTLSSLAVSGNATVGGTLGVTGTTTLGTISAGSSTLSGLAVTGPTFFGGAVSTSNGVVQIGTAVAASGTSSGLLTVGKLSGSTYPFTVDQYGNVAGAGFTGTTFTGNLVGNQSGGSVAATTLSASGAATLSSTLGVTGQTTLGAQLNGTSAIFSGNVQAASFTGTMTIGGGGVTMSGVVPIANGGTGQTSAANALSGLFSLAGTISQMIPGADLVNNSVTSTQLSSTGVSAGTYSSVTVGVDGRITSGTNNGSASGISDGNGDSISVGTGSMTYTIGSSGVGDWTGTGLMIGSSKAALDTLDVYGGVAIGTGYAGTTAAPLNGLIVQGQVGIGTASPSTLLQVQGATTITGADTTELSVTTSNAYGTAVSGVASDTSAGGASYGGYFTSSNTNGMGVKGWATNTSGGTYGGYFRSSSTGGIGLLGYADAITGTNYGVSASSNSSGGASLIAAAGNAATKGIIVKGYASQTGDLTEWQNSSGSALSVVNASGNVGIGTASPTASLNIVNSQNGGALALINNYTAGTGAFSALETQNDSGSQVLFGVASSAYTTIPLLTNYGIMYGNASVAGLAIDTQTAKPIIFGIANAEKMRVDSTGNVGLGTATPANTLDVNGSASIGYNVAAPSNSLIVNSQIGLGTATPWGVFQAHLATNANFMLNLLNTNVTKLGAWNDALSNYTPMDLEGNPLTLNLSSGGNVGIGTASPSYPLHVSSASGSSIYGYNSSTGDGVAGVSASGSGVVGVTNAGGSAYYGGVFSSGSYSGNIGRADGYAFVGVGAVWATGSDYFNQSDGRLKENIVALAGNLDKVEQLRPVSYTWKPGSVAYTANGKSKQLGLIAQDVEKVVPEAVTLNKMPPIPARTDGKKYLDEDLKDGTYGVAYIKLVPILIGAVRELKSLFDGDHEAIAKLKADHDILVAEHTADAKAIEELQKDVSELKRRMQAQ